jgi:hypothetical protein
MRIETKVLPVAKKLHPREKNAQIEFFNYTGSFSLDEEGRQHRQFHPPQNHRFEQLLLSD